MWYKQKINEIFKELDSSPEGLVSQEVDKRLDRYGLNQIAVKKTSLWDVIIEPFKSIFVVVLLVAAFVSLVSDHMAEAIIVMVIILINAAIFYTQNYATTRVLRSLKKTNVSKVTALRDGRQEVVMSINIVPGDVLYIAEGEKIPADARVIELDGLQVDESTLTGESVPVHKYASNIQLTRPIYEQENMVFQGTYAIAGTAKVLVVDTGNRTEFGKIAELATDKTSKSPVQVKIDQLVDAMIKIIAVVIVVVFILSLARGIPAGEALRFVLSMSVSAVPEGLPVALTVIIVLGMRRMAKRNVLVRSFKSIEDIGLVTTIATDKTGTLTKNHLTVVDSWEAGKDGVASLARKTLDSSVNLTDPLDIAIEEDISNRHASEIAKVYPFDLSSRMSGCYIESEKSIYIKGSPEHMLAKSSVSKKHHHEYESAMRELAAKGYRVLGIGRVKVTSKPPKDLSKIGDGEIELVGFLALADELRPEAKGAVHKAQLAGINVRLITGDHYETAYNIGKQLGIASSQDRVIKGDDLPKDPQALALVVQDKTIFARILPADKFRILQALKESEITAMTGDGVNDVPALANAHVGIAMGSGSDIARDAGGMVLLDNNFASIINAISEGRRIFDNIRRMLFYLLSTSLGEVLTMIGALLVGLPLPVTAIQILWINLMTDTAMVLPLGMEPAEKGHMRKLPRRPKDPLLNKILVTRLILVALTMALVTLFIVNVLVEQGRSTAYIQTVAMTVLVVAQWTNAFNARSEVASSFSRIKNINRGLLIGFAVAVILQVLVLFGPLGQMFNIQPVSLGLILLYSLPVALAVLAVSELHKYVVRLTVHK